MSTRNQPERPRRSTHRETPVSYAAVGASRAPDLLRFPPEGSTPYEEVVQVGSGQERYMLASAALMTWAAHRAAGLSVERIEQGAGGHYDGVTFSANGQPQSVPEREELYSPDGEPYLTAGTTVRVGAGAAAKEHLVVYTIAEERMTGFGWGDRAAADAYGEHRVTVEIRDDQSVWATVRGFVFTAQNGLFGLKGKNDVREVVDFAQRLLEALLPGATTVRNGIETPDEPLEESGRESGSSTVGHDSDEDIAEAELVSTSEILIVEDVIESEPDTEGPDSDGAGNA